ncbi:MAG: branched-chain amino acid ABC transporter permease [Synergistaceae bacterium]|jgi:branched-chain amino acid transport system permease protein|nr:branched-chain amino acid ABC transporter permease [Synergistaceae bacterium]
MQFFLQAVLDGILLGGVYATLALGISLAYGIMDVINWAAGETLMLGMYLAFVLISSFGMDPYATIFVTFPVMFALGFFMQKFMLNGIMVRSGHFAGHNVLLFTAGFSYIASSLISIFFGTLTKSAVVPYANSSISFGNFVAPLTKLVSCIIAVGATLILFLFIHRSEIGRAIRATSQDRDTAKLMGINSNLMFCIGFALSFALLGLTASLLIPYFPITPYIGATFSFKAFIIVVVGGKGNIMGALTGGMFVGLVEKVFGSMVNDSFAQILVFCLLILVLLVRPDGLLSGRHEG